MMPPRLRLSPRFSQPVRIRKTGVKARKGMHRETWQTRRARMYRSMAAVSRGSRRPQ